LGPSAAWFYKGQLRLHRNNNNSELELQSCVLFEVRKCCLFCVTEELLECFEKFGKVRSARLIQVSKTTLLAYSQLLLLVKTRDFKLKFNLSENLGFTPTLCVSFINGLTLVSSLNLLLNFRLPEDKVMQYFIYFVNLLGGGDPDPSESPSHSPTRMVLNPLS